MKVTKFSVEKKAYTSGFQNSIATAIPITSKFTLATSNLNIL